MDFDKRQSVILDTGFFVALAYRRDPLHTRARQAAEKFASREWVTTWPVLTEVFHLLEPQHCVELLKDQAKGLFRIFHLNDSLLPRVSELYEKYCDHPIDLADISLVLVAESLEHGRILSCEERDFSFLRWDGRKRFQNLLMS